VRDVGPSNRRSGVKMRRTRIEHCCPLITPIATTERTSRIGRFVPGPDVKWLKMLKQIAPAVTRVGVLRDPNTPSGIGQFGAMQGAASTFRVVLVPLGVRDAAEIERAVSEFASVADNGGLIVTTGGLTTLHRELISALALRHKLPAVYPADYFVTAGGLVSYGSDLQLDRIEGITAPSWRR
jgi:hypothetical protein